MSLQMAGAAAFAALLLIGITAVVWINLKRSSDRTEVARVQPSPAVAESPRPVPTITAETPQPIVAPTSAPEANVNVQGPSPNPTTTMTPAAPTTIALKDGSGFVAVDSEGNVSGLESLSPADQEAVRATLAKQRVAMPSMLASLAGSTAMLRGRPVEGVSFPILSPVGKVVRTKRPTLRWGALDGANDYVVSIFDRNFKKVAESQPQSGTEWTVTNPLPAGAVYTWHVVANRNGEKLTSPEAPAPEARFMVLDEARMEELNRAQQLYKGSHLTLGTLYARSGLLDDAEREFQLLLRDNPNSPVARRLLQSVRALRDSK
jgi:hypothetical protein